MLHIFQATSVLKGREAISVLLPGVLDCGCPTKTFLQSASQIRMKAS